MLIDYPDTQVSILHHAVVDHAIASLRNPNAGQQEFAEAVDRITRILAVAASARLPRCESVVTTMTGATATCRTIEATILMVPVLRAGLGMLRGFQDILPTAVTGFIGLRRDEETLHPEKYYVNVPDRPDAHVFILDPMLATGRSAVAALQIVRQIKPSSLTMMSIIAAPDGVREVRTAIPEASIFIAALDEGLNDSGYIVPGLGDAGDRIWGTL